MVAIIASLLLGLPCQDNDSPIFKHWSGWKAGAWVKLKLEAEFLPGNKVESEMTTKALEITADKIVVEQSGKARKGGQTFELPTEKQEIKPKDSKFTAIEKEGDEEIELSGKKIKCHWIQMTQDHSQAKITSKFWFSKEIPGGLAKSETTKEGGVVLMKMQAVDWGEK